MREVRALRVAAGVEAVSLAVLLLNLATVHADPVSALAGPVHGTAYLAVIALARPVPPARRCSLLPGVGGLLATRIAARTAAATPTDTTPDTGTGIDTGTTTDTTTTADTSRRSRSR